MGFALRAQPDTRLVALVRDGHDRAFEEIVRRYRAPLVAFAAAIVPPHRAEDVVQEALVRAHRAIAAGEAELKLRPWLYTVVRNRALNDLRDERTHEHLDENHDGVPQPPQIVAQREDLRSVVAGLQGLPHAQREALLRREFEGRSHDEIAAALGSTPGAVRGLIFRARTALRESLGLLIPFPLLRLLADADPGRAEAVGAGGVAVGVVSAGGGGVAVKAGAALAVAVIAAGSGLAIHGKGGKEPSASKRAVVVSTTPGDGAKTAPGGGETVALAKTSQPADSAAHESGSSDGSSYSGTGSSGGDGGSTYGDDGEGSGSSGGDDGSSESSGSDSSGGGGDRSGSDGGSGSDDTALSETSDSTSDSSGSGSGDTAEAESVSSGSSDE
jgi:RNA polymerase sigma factor (sigma-70 family)